MTATKQPDPPNAAPWWRIDASATVKMLGQAIPEPAPLELTCPCPLRGLRCGDCMMIAFAPPPFKATPLGWTLATLRRFGWRIRGLFTSN
jgi:hypothetical protein